MDFKSLIAPLTPEKFEERFANGSSFVIRGTPDKFSGLISLEDIERRLNDGCNLNSPPYIIKNGDRQDLADVNIAWTKLSLRKKEFLQHLRKGNSFMMTNLSQINPGVASLIDTIEDGLLVKNMRADLHLYISTRGNASAYDAHRDYPQHKIYLQVIGNTDWHVYNHKHDLPHEIRHLNLSDEKKHLEEVAFFTLEPGDLFYMPPAVFHKVANSGGPRVSLSIPVAPDAGPRMDRTYIPFAEIFRDGLNL